MPENDLPPFHPDQPEEEIPPYDALPDDGPLDEPAEGEVLAQSANPSFLPRLILGCAPFGYGIFASTSSVLSSMPLRLVWLALRSGVTAFDTAPWYHPSEIVLGHALRALAPEWPRERYRIISKVGKYGPGAGGHTYDAEVVTRSVQRSLRRLGTEYLDVVFLHDVEFVASVPCPAGDPLLALSSSHAASFGLTEPQLVPSGPGDLEILAGISALRALQADGKVLRVGIAGYPLPTLLRLALLVLHTTGRPLDIVQTYMHQTLANSTLAEGFLAAFTARAKVPLVTNASPLGMGLLTTAGCPEWHPARKGEGRRLYDATREAVALCEQRGRKLEDVACEYGYRTLRHPASGDGEGERGTGNETEKEGEPVPVVVGCKNLEELHSSLKAFAKAAASGASGGADGDGDGVAGEVMRLFDARGVRNWSMASPVPRDAA